MTKLPVPTESQEAQMLVAYLRVKGHQFTHIGNETGHSPEAVRRAVRLKREGVSRGFPDYLIILSDRLVAIELKRTRGSRVTDEQREWLWALARCGVEAAICYGATEAIEWLESLK